MFYLSFNKDISESWETINKRLTIAQGLHDLRLTLVSQFLFPYREETWAE